MDSLKDASELGRDLVAGKNAAIDDVDVKKALKLNAAETFASVKDDALTTVGLGNDLRVKVKRTSASVDPQVLFESDYGYVDFGYEVSADKNGVVAPWAMDSLKDASELGRDLVAGKNAAIEDVDGIQAL